MSTNFFEHIPPPSQKKIKLHLRKRFRQHKKIFFKGLAVSDGPGSPGHAPPHQPGLGGDPGSPGVDPLPARPQPARSPYEWMKRPSINGRPCKEGTSSPDGEYSILLGGGVKGGAHYF